MNFNISLFCSLYRGKAMIEKLLSFKNIYPEIVITGIATDDPTQPWTNSDKRIWRHSHLPDEKHIIEDLARKNNIPLWKSRVNTEDFYQAFTEDWAPDVCYMGVFGQKIPERIWSHPLHGFYNLHTCSGKTWPSDIGGDPISSILGRGLHHGSLAMHQIDNEWDQGELVAFSDYFPISKRDAPLAIQKRSAPLAADLMIWHLSSILGIPSATKTPRIVAERSMGKTVKNDNYTHATA